MEMGMEVSEFEMMYEEFELDMGMEVSEFERM